MWDQGLSIGCILMSGAWATAVGLIGLGWLLGHPYLGQAGIACSALGAALMVIHDNGKTRRAMRGLAAQERIRSL